MIKVLQIRKNTCGRYDGTDHYCRELNKMFETDTSIEVLPVADIQQKFSFFHYSYKTEILSSEIKKADVVHVNGYTAWGTRKAILLSKKMGKKVVYTAHWHPFKYLRHPLLGRLFFTIFLEPVITRCVDVVVTINNEDTEFFRGFSKQVVKIPHAYSKAIPSQFTEKKKDMILFVGRINDQVKGFNHVLAIPEGKFDIRCVGEGDIPENRKDITHYCNISEEELDALYSKASLVVVPSRYEAFSYVTLDALMHGVPVVVSDKVRIIDYLPFSHAVSCFTYGDITTFVDLVEKKIGQSFDIREIYDIFSVSKVRKMYRSIYLG